MDLNTHKAVEQNLLREVRLQPVSTANRVPVVLRIQCFIIDRDVAGDYCVNGDSVCRLVVDDIETTITDNPHSVDIWIEQLLTIARSRPRFFVGMDIGVSCHTSKPVTLHLCVGTRCLIIHLDKLSYPPDSLHRFCADQTHRFIGYNIGDNVRRIKELDVFKNLEFADQIEIGDEKWKNYITENLSRDQQIMVWIYRIESKNTVQVDGMMTLDQVKKAAHDAHCCYCTGFLSIP